MQKKYLKIQYYATVQYRGFYKDTKRYDSLEELKKYLNLNKNYFDRGSYVYPMIDYVIYEIKPIKHLVEQYDS